MGDRREVLLIEDDATLAEALRKFFERDKLKVHHTHLGSEARKILDQNPIGLVVSDCLLPDGSGVDVLAQVKKTYPYPLNIVLTSGVFTDQAFVKEAVRSTQALGFLKKPFDLGELKPFMPADTTTTQVAVVPARQQLYSLFRKESISAREKARAIEALEEVHGYDLPFIYSLLVETKASGFLNMAGVTGQVYGVSFSNGSIVQVDFPDENTFLGALLIDHGFIDSTELESVAQNKDGSRLGQKLMQANLVSPHALDVVMTEQMNIRLSKTVRDEMFQINFVESSIDLAQPAVDVEIFSNYLHDWIASKISVAWLKTHFLPWLDSEIMYGPHYSQQHPAVQMPLVNSLNGFVSSLGGKSLNQVLDLKKWDEEATYKVLYFLLTKGMIVFKEVKSKPGDRVRSFQKIQDQVRGKNKLEIYSILSQMVGVNDQQPAQVLSEFLKLLGSEPSRELRLQHQQLVRIAEEACDFAKKSNRDRLRKDLSRDDVEMKLKAASSFEEAKGLLQRSQFRQALEILKKASAVDSQLPQIKLYLAWAKLSSASNDKERTQIIGNVEMDLLQIPPEEKTSSLYHFVMGLNHKSKGDKLLARKQFEKALGLDPEMIVARRELNFLRTQMAEKKDVMNRDLRDLVGSFFRKAK